MSTAMPGFKEYSTLWKKYRVMGAKITVESASPDPVLIGIHMCNEAWTPANWAELMRVINGNGNSVCKLQEPVGKTVTKMYRSMGGILGNKLAYKASDSYCSNITTTPDDIIHGYVFGIWSEGTSPTSVVIRSKVTVTMYIQFYEKYDQAKD